MKKRLLSFFAAMAISVSMFSFLGFGASAAEREADGAASSPRTVGAEYERAAKREYSLLGVASRSTFAYPAVGVYHNSQSLGNIGRRINGEDYIPIRKFIESTTSLRVVYNSSSRVITVSGGGHNISVSDGAYAIYASGRVIFSSTPSVILSDGRMYVPARALAKVLSLSYSRNSSGAVLSGSVRPIVSGDKYYREDEVYWLSRIISAESRGEPLIGQIAVGSVILNRVRSSAYPNTIWGVIFDKKYGVQFSPVSNGTIYNTPTQTSVLAAKICLEGFFVSEDVKYFLAPRAATSSWIENNRPYLFTIGRHDFYA